MLRTLRKAEYLELIALFYLQGAALGMWFVPLSNVLDTHGLHDIKPYAFACSALAAFVSPLIFGALADRSASPVRVLRGLALATAFTMALAATAIKLGWHPGVVLALVQAHALCSSPTWSISSAIVFSRLADAKMEFGPIRAMGTFGWMSGCWLISALNADASVLAGFAGAGVWLTVSGFTYFLPQVTNSAATQHLSWRERLGLDALTLLKHPDHRVIFITVAMFAMPLCGFYPFTPPQLRELGFQRTSAWMSLGQVTEIIAMLLLGGILARCRLKWIIATGLSFGVLRFALSALNGRVWLLGGVLLHGVSFTLVFITAQIYLEQRVDAAWRARAQALMALMLSGVGNLAGYLGTGWWFKACSPAQRTQWPRFWVGLALAVALVLLYFLVVYRGRKREEQVSAPS